MEVELNDRAYVKPAPGLKIVDPDSGYVLPDTGKEVIYTSFWHRRVLQGDCVLVTEPPPLVTEVQASELKRAARSAKKETGGNDQ